MTKKTFVARDSCKSASSPGYPLVVRVEISKKNVALLDCDVPEQALRDRSRLSQQAQPSHDGKTRPKVTVVKSVAFER
ncbi:hypothetical protein ABIB06_002194 [Bradyrhizobium sp. LB8.2]|uniref:hypothetical protein n=1 Tax=unclassified Bradyrhizobium TaxID=2631580 RepID=UPI00339B435F